MFELPVLTFKFLVLSYITAKRQLIHDRTTSRNTWNQNYDFIIVGAGTAGSIIANRISEDPNVNVLLLEAGQPLNAIYNDIPGMWQFLDTDRPDLNWHYYYEPENDLGFNFPSHRWRYPYAKQIGGSSSHNGMVYHRGNRRDYDNWVNTYGAEGWSYREVLPFFRKFENNTNLEMVLSNPGYYGTNGPIQLSISRNIDPILRKCKNVFNELGYYSQDLNASNQTGTMIALSHVDQRAFRSQAGVYIDPNPHPNNLHIVTRALVIKILFDGLTAIGVEFDRNDTSYRVYARNDVILSAGVFQTPQLLMQSGIGPRNQLKELGIPVLIDLPVGNNYNYILAINIIPNINQSFLNSPRILTIDNLSQLYFNRSGPLSQWPTGLLYFRTRYNNNREWPNAFLLLYIYQGQFNIHLNIAELISRGSVRLQSTSPYIQPILDSNYLSDSRDFDNLYDGLQYILYLIETSNMRQFMTPPTFESIGCRSCEGKYMYECESGIRCLIQRSAFYEHDCCTCRMGAIKRNDVVIGPDIRVKHAQNLRVCDASIFPVMTNGGINTDTLMAGERCSQIIKNFYNLH